MASKFELAQYLVNLHILATAQEQVGVQKSKWLIDEYTNTWDQFKSATEKENTDEARNRQQSDGGHKAGTHKS